MGNLHRLLSGDPRPFHSGQVSGTKSSVPVSQALEWLIDTGAQISVVHSSTGALFDLGPSTLAGASARATTGSTGIALHSGLTVEFDVLQRSGATRPVACSALDVGIKSNNSGSEILGMDQLEAERASVHWNPVRGDGNILD